MIVFDRSDFDRLLSLECNFSRRVHLFSSNMVDRTTYTNDAATPKIALRQIFGRLGVAQGLCKAAADAGLLSVEIVAMLGDTATAAKEQIKAMISEDQLGDSAARRDLSTMQLAAVWQACQALQTQFASRRARMEEDPNKIPEMAQEDHAEFRARFVRNHPDVVTWCSLMQKNRTRSSWRSSAETISSMEWFPTTPWPRSGLEQTVWFRSQGSAKTQRICW